VNDADVKVCPLTPVIVAPADALVAVVQGFDKCRTPSLNVDVGVQLTPGPTKVQGTSAAAAEPASANAATTAAVRMTFFIRLSLLIRLPNECLRLAAKRCAPDVKRV
jgi:hypothetical protein